MVVYYQISYTWACTHCRKYADPTIWYGIWSFCAVKLYLCTIVASFLLWTAAVFVLLKEKRKRIIGRRSFKDYLNLYLPFLRLCASIFLFINWLEECYPSNNLFYFELAVNLSECNEKNIKNSDLSLTNFRSFSHTNLVPYF